MDKAEITNMKSNIRAEYELKIKKLQEEMEDVLLSLSRMEKTLTQEPSAENYDREREAVRYIRIPGTKKHKEAIAKNEKQRVMLALQKMNPKFSTEELKEQINNDGSGRKIKKGTFAGIFADLKRTGQVIIVDEKKGNRGGIYKKVDQALVQSKNKPEA